MSRLFFPLPVSARQSLYLMIVSVPVAQKTGTPDESRSLSPQHHVYLTYRYKPGITVTQGWTTAALLDTKVEFASLMSQPVKAEFQNLFNPNAPSKAAQKLNLTFKQPNLHARAFLDHSAAGNINALIDATVGHEGFVAGAEAGYDVSKAAITRYSAGLGYQAPTFTASLIAMQNLSVLAASYYQKVNSNVEAGAKATYDLQGGKSVGLEVASKYKLDPLSFAKVRLLFDSSISMTFANHHVHYRPRSTTVVLLPLPTTPSSTPVPPSALVFRSTPTSSTRLATRSAPASSSRVKQIFTHVDNASCNIFFSPTRN
jgi:voltage-dependent anion channel protein 2